MKTKTQFTKQLLSIVLSLVMVIGLLPTHIISASAISDHTHNFEDSFWDFDPNGHWHRCIAEDCEITDYSATNEVGTVYSVHADADADGICDTCNYHITHEHTGWTELTADVLATNSYTLGDGKYYLSDNLDTTQKIYINGNVCLCLNGKTVKANASMSNPYQVIEIKKDHSLDLYDCSGTHAGKITGGSARNGSGVIGYGTLRMFGGTITENNKDRTTKDDSNGDGAAVMVETEFVMYDGIISGNKGDWGGGVYTRSNSCFAMYGGTITGNIASGNSGSAGGGVCAAGKTFDMYGGKISGNYAGFRSGGVYVDTNTTFNMYGGEISNNGLADDHNAKAHGGGVAFQGTFNLFGGRIYNNNTVYGGGVANYYSENNFNMYGGEIYNNTATYGGGVCIGEVYTGTDNAGFNMSGGKIYGNKADTVGGVYVGSNGSFDLSGGEITNNIATGQIGGGVFVDSASISFTLSGRPVISENKKDDCDTDIVLAGDKKITINDELTTDSPLGVALLSDGLLSTGDFTKNWSTHMLTADCNDYFFSSDDNYGVKLSENGEELELYVLPEHRDWLYSKTGNVITATCGITGCMQSGGNVTLNISDDYYTGNAVGATVQGGFTNGATYKITYDNGSEAAPSSIGTHIAKLTVYENGTKKHNLTLEYKISHLSAPNPAYTISGAYEDNGTYWFKSGTSVTVNAPTDYVISDTLDGSYGQSISFSESDSKVIYLKRTSDDAMTDGVDISSDLRFDSTTPVGKITIDSRNFWQQLLNKITFGLFLKGDKAATVTSSDVDSGVKSIEYYVASEDLIDDATLGNTAAVSKLENAIGGNWNTYNNEILLNNNAKNVIYTRITDNVGNITYISSDGIVLDSISPVLYGIENGGVYHGDKVFKAMDENFLKIEVDGVDITDTTEGDDEYKIIADNAEHTVTVTDKAGNVTEYKITVYKKYMVTYTNGEGGSYEKEFKYGEVITIPTNEIFKDTFHKMGYTIKEWQGYTEGMTMPLKDLTFTAVYAPCEYTVTFDQNGGEVISPITVTFGEKYGSLPSSAITGLSGGNKNWYLVDADGNVTETNIKNLTLVSTTRDHKLFIKRNVLAPSVSVALTVPGGISDGYQYYIPGASKRVLTASVGNMNTEILEYTYRWYKDGTLIEGATSNVLTLDGNVSDSGTYKVEVTATLKDGANIVVGSDTATASKEQNVKILHTTNTLNYDANGGEGGSQSSYTGGTGLNVSKDVPTREHYNFIGWNTAPDGTGDSYKAEDAYAFANDNGNGGCEVTLYAQWKLVEYTVTYKANGEPISTETVGHGKDATLPAVPAKDGYVGKWDIDGKNITGDTTITAVYTAIPIVKPDEVKPMDKTDLEDAKAKLEEMLEDDSYTDDDKKDIQDAIDDIVDALEVIGNVEVVEELIDKLPESITKNDEDTIKAADDAYNTLTEYEKSLVDEDAKKALDDARAALAGLNKPVTDRESPQTGDNSNMFLWIALLFISGGAVITLTVVDRKKRSTVNK